MTDGDPRLEHIAGPTLRGALLCGRCGEVLAILPPGPWQTGPLMPGDAVVSDGTAETVPARASGSEWPYTKCQWWHPVVGQRPGPWPEPARPEP